MSVDKLIDLYVLAKPLGGKLWRWYVRRTVKRRLVAFGLKVDAAEHWLAQADAKIAQLDANLAKLPRGDN